MITKTLKIGALALGLASVGVLAAKPADTVSAREANFKVMGKGMKGISDQLKTAAPDMAVIKANANGIAQAATKVGGFFPKGSGPESGVRTHALPVIWTKNADFRAAAQRLVDASKKLKGAADSGNLDAVKAAMPGVGGACKGCHDTFKARD